MIDFKDKKIAILGLGEENLELIKFLNKFAIELTICDERGERELEERLVEIKELSGVKFRFGSGYLDNLTDFGLVFRTPGLPYFHPKIQEAKKSGVEISSQMKLFFSLCPCPIIGVTGTKGKGTTATLIEKILKWKSEIRSTSRRTKSEIYLAGNIGNAPIGFVDKLKPDDIVILELSSFQLQDMDQSPHIAVVLDIKVDHLDYHQDEKEYVEAKLNIVKHQQKEDFAVINLDYLKSFNFAAETKAEVFFFSRRKAVDRGVWVKNNQEFFLRMNDQDSPLLKTSEVTLRGEHNLENIAAAMTTAHLAGAEIESMVETVKNFAGLEHRLEFVTEKDGVKFYNDSFSTTPDTTTAAIRSFKEPIVLLIGGSEKNADYKDLAKEIDQSSVKTIINIGQTGERIIKEIARKENIEIISNIQNITQAVSLAREKAEAGDVVLLSPASASFDNFKNYKERGNLFKQEVKND